MSSLEWNGEIPACKGGVVEVGDGGDDVRGEVRG